jgi:hypothetical protein
MTCIGQTPALYFEHRLVPTGPTVNRAYRLGRNTITSIQ